MKSEKYKVIECVPFQRCPICNGTGTEFVAQIDPMTTATYGYQICTVCGGSKVIPMAVIPEKK